MCGRLFRQMWLLRQRKLSRLQRAELRWDQEAQVITKPGPVDEGAEDKMLDLVEGKYDVLELGWVVVQTLGQRDLHDAAKMALLKKSRCVVSPPFGVAFLWRTTIMMH